MRSSPSECGASLAETGFVEGRTFAFEYRGADNQYDLLPALAADLVRRRVAVIVAVGAAATLAAKAATKTIPIVFASLTDPVATNVVARLDRPEGNTTGFVNLEASVGGKWLALLSEIAPGLKRAAIMFDPDTVTASFYMPSVETAARSLKVDPIPVPVRSDVEIETAINAFGREPGAENGAPAASEA